MTHQIQVIGCRGKGCLVFSPSILVIEGRRDGNPAVLMQHRTGLRRCSIMWSAVSHEISPIPWWLKQEEKGEESEESMDLGFALFLYTRPMAAFLGAHIGPWALFAVLLYLINETTCNGLSSTTCTEFNFCSRRFGPATARSARTKHVETRPPVSRPTQPHHKPHDPSYAR